MTQSLFVIDSERNAGALDKPLNEMASQGWELLSVETAQRCDDFIGGAAWYLAVWKRFEKQYERMEGTGE